MSMQFRSTILLLLFLRFSQTDAWQKTKLPHLYLVTVASNETDGFRQWRRSAEEFGHDYRVFGMGQKWNGGTMEAEGGGQKVRLLRDGLRVLSDAKKEGADDEALVIFTDAYDVILNAGAETITRRFLEEFHKNRVLFGAEPYCWPDKSLANKYPQVTFGERFLNSGGFIGYLSDILALLEQHGKNVEDSDDDQLFYTRLYLDEEIRTRHKIGLDSLSRIFQNLHGMKAHVELQTDENGNAMVFNALYNTHPVVIHGNGPSKLELNSFGNYIANKYNLDHGCADCEPLLELPSETPLLTLAVFIAKPVPYVEEFLETLLPSFDYPKDRIHLYLYNNQEYNRADVDRFAEQHAKDYKAINFVNMNEKMNERHGRTDSIDWAMESNADFYLALDADAHLTNPLAIKQLIRRLLTYKIGILAPVILQPGKLFSNFWGAISSSGFYERSNDYLDIVEGHRRGYWYAPFINYAYLIEARKLPILREAYWYDQNIDADMSFAKFCRQKGHFMYVDNQEYYGFLIESDFFGQLNAQTIHREVYDYPHNKQLWETRYIHPLYHEIIKPDTEVEMPCPDVYDFPFLSDRFAAEIIEIMEHFGRWSNGKNEDERLAGGYENVPTRDIHMRQVGLHGQFLSIIDDYVAPVQEKVFYGYYQRPIKSDMMFVVRYKPEEQASLRPHLDASTYSIDVALNRKGVDYEGGGVRYVRYNCTIAADRIGWSMLFPGRLSHLHEGLPTTKGTRYILVSFINP